MPDRADTAIGRIWHLEGTWIYMKHLHTYFVSRVNDADRGDGWALHVEGETRASAVKYHQGGKNVGRRRNLI